MKSDTDTLSRIDSDEEMNQFSDRSSMTGEENLPLRDYVLKNTDKQIEIRGFGKYIRDGKRLIT